MTATMRIVAALYGVFCGKAASFSFLQLRGVSIDLWLSEP